MMGLRISRMQWYFFEFSPVASDQTRQAVQDAVDLSKAGLRVDAREIVEKTGYRVVES